jgi:pyruvate carboxylase subunit B
MPPLYQRFRAIVGRHTFEVEVGAGELRVNGVAVDYDFSQVGEGYFSMLTNGRSTPVVVTPGAQGILNVTLGEQQVAVRVKDEKDLLLERFGLDTADTAADLEVRAPMPGLVLKVAVEPGQSVAAGDSLLVLEAMKMENELRAPGDTVVKAVHAAPGDAVGKNALLIEFVS